jgi:hypothetical protein
MNTFFSIYNYLLYIVLAVSYVYIVWTFKTGIKIFEKWKEEIAAEISIIKQNQINLRIELPEKYVLFNRFEVSYLELKTLLQKILDKLDTKEDKDNFKWDGSDRRKKE